MQIKNQRGFTLVELLLVLALISIVIAAGWNAFALGQTAWQNLQTKLEAEAAVRHASQIISYELNLASFLEIRQVSNRWTNEQVRIDDRIIFVDNNGAIIMREKTAAGNVDRTIAAMERGTLHLTFTKPLNINDSNTPHAPIANSLDFVVSAIDRNNNTVYSLNSVTMLSNMLPDSGVPISDISLYSQIKTSNYLPGDIILYRTKADPFNPQTPEHSPVGCY